MEVNIKVSDPYGIGRKGYLIRQGIPVQPMNREDVQYLALLDERGKEIPAAIEHDGRDENDKTVWVRVTTSLDIKKDAERHLKLVKRQSPVEQQGLIRFAGKYIVTPFYELRLDLPGSLLINVKNKPVIDGCISFQLWPDARSIVGGGGGTCRLSSFIPLDWSVEEVTPHCCLIVLKGRIPKCQAYTSNPNDFDADSHYDCELEMLVNGFSPVIRLRWRFENQCNYQTYLERYALKVQMPDRSRITGGDKSDDGKYLKWITADTPGGPLAFTAHFVDKLGAGAGINSERRENLGNLKMDQVLSVCKGGVFEPHRYLAAKEDPGWGLDVIVGGINPPQDATMWADNPEVHRLFYRGMGRTFEGSLIIGGGKSNIESELNPIFFELEPDYYSRTGALPENGDPVNFGPFKKEVFASAEWMLKEQWTGSLWWGEWWREYDNCRQQGIEATANGNNPLGALYHYWRTGDIRFVECAKRSAEFVYDIQLNKRKDTIAPFFHSRRFLIDQIEWVHMRYARFEGPMKLAHFTGDRRLREKLIDAMRKYANALVMPDGAPGFAEGGARGKAVPAGADCTNFGEVLGICYKETGEKHFLDKAIRMADWTLRFMSKWDWNEYVGNSYGWHFLMRGMLSTIKLTGKKKYIEWYVDMARRNMTYPIEQIEFVQWMNWLIVEAEKMSGETWLLDELPSRTRNRLQDQQGDGTVIHEQKWPWSKFPSAWQYIYDPKCIVSYIPVMTARRAALGLDKQASG